MSLSKSLNFGADTLILGQGDQDVNIVSQNGTDIKINGIVPSAGGGGGVPAVGDIDFIGNLNCNDVAGGGSKGIITAEKKVVSGLDGIFSSGEIKTGAANDIHAGKDLVFDGQDLYKSYPGVVPAIPNKTYKEYKNLIAPTDNVTYTGTNIFRDNAVSIQALNDDVPAVYENTITLNTNGNIQCETINNVTSITTGTITCDNGGVNECKARVFNTRTSGTNGWNIKQAVEEANPPGKAANNILQIAATQAQAVGELVEVYITSSEYDPSNGDNPNIKLIPDTVLNGGKVQASQYDLGTAPNRYYLKQDIGGPNDKVLQIKAPTNNASVNFKDNSNADILVVKNTSIDLANSIPINFGAYSFRPIQYVYSNTIEIRGTPDNTGYTNMVFNCLGNATQPTLGGKNLWTNLNTGATNVSLYNDALEGFYKCSIKQTALSSSGNFKGTEIIFDYILAASTQDTPDLTPPISYGYNTFPADRAGPPALSTVASVLIDHKNSLSSQSQPVFLSFSDPPVSVSPFETMAVQIKLTKLDF